MSDDDKVLLLPGSDESAKVEVSRKAACMSELMRSMLDDDDEETPEIPLLEVSKDILHRIVDFMNYHKDNPMATINKPIQTNDITKIVSEWDAKFIDLEHDQETLFKIILAANYMDIPSLLDLGICKIACMVKGKDPDEVKDMFHIEKDITPEEEKLVRDQNPWIFDINPNGTQ